MYYSVIDTLQRLVSCPGYLELCEEWRQNQANMPNGYLTDIYTGYGKCGVHKADLLLVCLGMLNIDWLQPFEHTG